MNKKLADWKASVVSIAAENKIKRSKKEKRTLPAAKSNVKRVRFVVWAVIVCICLTGVLGFARAQNALYHSKKAEAKVEKMQKNPNQDQSIYNSPKLAKFGDMVVKAYVPISANTDDRAKQLAELEKMYAKDVPVPEFGDFTGHRDLRAFEMFNVVHEADKAVLQYKVSYTNVVTGEQPKPEEPKEDEEKEEDKKPEAAPETKTDKEALLNVPVKAVKGGFIVIENPYFSNVPKLVGKKVEAVSNPYSNDKMIDVNKSDQIQKWLAENFFPKYASEDETEMMYMMEEPQSLQGVQDFLEIDSIKVYPAKKKNEYVVKTVATFKEKELDIQQAEAFTIVLRDSDNKFFVEKLSHTLGGK
ncbi:conjugal transfer protein [Priestia megaterium]